MTSIVHVDSSDGEIVKELHASIRLRAYRASDLKTMHALDVVCFKKQFRFSLAAMRRFAEARNAKVVIAEQNHVLLGFVIVHVEEAEERLLGYVITLDVGVEHRRTGVASALMHRAEELAAESGCDGMALHVFTDNETALRFYAHAGFGRVHRANNFYGCGLDAWFCYRSLPPRSSNRLGSLGCDSLVSVTTA